MNEERTNRKTEKKQNALTKKTSPQKKEGSFFCNSLEIFLKPYCTHTFKYINILLFFCFLFTTATCGILPEKKESPITGGGLYSESQAERVSPRLEVG